METGESPKVQTAAHLCKSVIYNNRERFMASVIVAGYDKVKGGQVYVVPLSGMVIRKKIYISGSGSIYPMGYLDAHYRPDMTKEECLALVQTGNVLFSHTEILPRSRRVYSGTYNSRTVS